jgi:hypothetical protein
VDRVIVTLFLAMRPAVIPGDEHELTEARVRDVDSRILVLLNDHLLVAEPRAVYIESRLDAVLDAAAQP